MTAKKKDPTRSVPAARVADFIRQYIDANIETDTTPGAGYDHGISQFAFESGMNERRIYSIMHGQTTNVLFETVDEMLSMLDRTYLWQWSPEEGGFSDCYQDVPAPEAEPTVEQRRYQVVQAAKRNARIKGRDWMDVLFERAQQDMAVA